MVVLVHPPPKKGSDVSAFKQSTRSHRNEADNVQKSCLRLPESIKGWAKQCKSIPIRVPSGGQPWDSLNFQQEPFLEQSVSGGRGGEGRGLTDNTARWPEFQSNTHPRQDPG